MPLIGTKLQNDRLYEFGTVGETKNQTNFAMIIVV